MFSAFIQYTSVIANQPDIQVYTAPGIGRARDVRPRGQLLATSASASSRWPRPRVCGLSLELNEAKAEAQRLEKLF